MTCDRVAVRLSLLSVNARTYVTIVARLQHEGKKRAVRRQKENDKQINCEHRKIN